MTARPEPQPTPRPWWKPPRNDFLSWATYWWPAWFALGFVILSWLLRL